MEPLKKHSWFYKSLCLVRVVAFSKQWREKSKECPEQWSGSGPSAVAYNRLKAQIYFHLFSAAPFPPRHTDLLLSPQLLLALLAVHPVPGKKAHSNQHRQEASVPIAMPAASNVICQMLAFSKFNLREMHIILWWLLLVRRPSRIEPLGATGNNERFVCVYKQEMENQSFLYWPLPEVS